jgi:hypothetical protein
MRGFAKERSLADSLLRHSGEGDEHLRLDDGSRVDEMKPEICLAVALDSGQACGRTVDLCTCGYAQIRSRSADLPEEALLDKEAAGR